jgi:hypothetical protein
MDNIENLLTWFFLDKIYYRNFHLMIFDHTIIDEKMEKLEKENNDIVFWKEETEKEIIGNIKRKFE